MKNHPQTIVIEQRRASTKQMIKSCFMGFLKTCNAIDSYLTTIRRGPLCIFIMGEAKDNMRILSKHMELVGV